MIGSELIIFAKDTAHLKKLLQVVEQIQRKKDKRFIKYFAKSPHNIEFKETILEEVEESNLDLRLT